MNFLILKNKFNFLYKKEFLILKNNDFCPQWLTILFVSFRFDLFRFVSFCFVSFRFFRFVSVCFVSFRFVSFRFDLFRFVPFRFCFVSHFTGTLKYDMYLIPIMKSHLIRIHVYLLYTPPNDVELWQDTFDLCITLVTYVPTTRSKSGK